MHLRDPSFVGVDRFGSDDPREAGDHDVVDRMLLEDSRQRAIEQIEVAPAHPERDPGYSMPFRVTEGVRVGSVCDHEGDPRTDDRILEERLQMSAPMGTEDGDADVGSSAALIRSPKRSPSWLSRATC